MPQRLARSTGFALALAFVALTSLGCSSGGGGGGSAPEPVVDVVSLLTAATVPLALTGETSTEIVALLSLSDGLVLLNDAVSSSVLLLDAFGAMSLYTADSELMTLSGQASVSLGPLDEVISGTGLGDVYGADSVSGLLFRLGTDGVPTVHATKESILRVTDGTDSRLSLPRFLTNNQIIAQELFGNALLRFGTTPVNPQEFVSADVLATAAGVAPAAAVVSGWARQVGSNAALFARFLTTNNIVKVQVNGQLATHMLGSDLELLFPDVDGLHILDFVSDTVSDVLLLIVGERVSGVARGVAVALVTVEGAVGVFADAASLLDEAGFGYDLTDIGVLRDGVPFAVDSGRAQVLTFNSTGAPVVIGKTESIVRESGAAVPQISIAALLGDSNDVRGVVVPEAETDNLLLVE